MTDFVATFYTHFAAQSSYSRLLRAGISARMAPTPRELSASCGACVKLSAEEPRPECMDGDAEALYQVDGNGRYIAVWKNNF